MKRILLFLIICSFLTQASIKTVIFIDWKINQIRITEVYCVNKDNPLMHCNGKCYLSQQLKKIEADYEQSKAPFNPKNLKSTEFLLFVEKMAYRSSEHQRIDQSATLDPSLQSGIALTAVEKSRIIDFLKTLTDYEITSSKWLAEPTQ